MSNSSISSRNKTLSGPILDTRFMSLLLVCRDAVGAFYNSIRMGCIKAGLKNKVNRATHSWGLIFKKWLLLREGNDIAFFFHRHVIPLHVLLFSRPLKRDVETQK